ncbi:hypothetical protein PS15p_212034 [Mucor circinelloides]
MWAEYNSENTVINYGDTLGIPFLQGIMNSIDTAKVKLIHDKLRMQDLLLKTPFDSSDLHHNMQQNMLCKLANKADVVTTITFGLWNKSIQTQPATDVKS